ncbi:MAG TPA: serine/threonine-protein kinase [Nannocystaceae bacterium]|nr:serine/threonine-protein kinase [Nannocystaceae bacterium]
MSTLLDSSPPTSAASTTLLGDPGASRSHGDDLELSRGAVVGRYVVLARLGAGGMGVVYAAWDPELDRKVAIKVLRGDTKRSDDRAARMLREAQALARLAHPNVVAIHDVGTLDDRVWLAMEFIEGPTYGDWMRAQTRSWREVLDVLAPVAAGLSAAHAAGLVHRDVKPDNVMLSTEADGTITRVRLMDFGLARSIAARADDGEEITDVGGRTPTPHAAEHSARAGTPGYMAPEQWLNLPCDARSDQFSFCVMLWESLFSKRAFTGETLADLAANVLAGSLQPLPRGTRVPSWLRRVVRRGLARNPKDRHASMAALSGALAQGRAGAGRRRAVVMTVAVALVVASAFGVRAAVHAQGEARCAREGEALASAWTPAERDRLREGLVGSGVPYASDTAERVMPWLDDHAAAMRDAGTAVCIDELDARWSADLVERARWCLDERNDHTAAVIDLLAQGGARAVEHAVRAVASLPAVQPCRDVDVLTRMPALPKADRERARAIRSVLSRASATSAAGAYGEAAALSRDALDEAESLGWAPLIAAAHRRLGYARESAGEFDEAERELAESYFIALAAGELDEAAISADNLAFAIGVRLARPNEGLYWSRHAEVLLAGAPDPTGAREANHLSTRANVMFASGDYAEAVALHERTLAIREQVLGRDHPETAIALNNLANAIFMQGDYARAAELYGESCTAMQHSLGPDHPNVPTCEINLATALVSSGAHARAVEIYTRALPRLETTLGARHPSVAALLTNLAGALIKTGDPAGAEKLYHRAIAIWEGALGQDHPTLAHPLVGLATIALDRGDATAALPFAERAHALRSREGTQPEAIAETQFLLARALWDTGGDRVRARELAEQAAAFWREHPDKVAEPDTPAAWLAAHH